MLDVLNVLNDAAEENLVTDTLYTCRNEEFTKNSTNIGRPSLFMYPPMISVRLNLGQ